MDSIQSNPWFIENPYFKLKIVLRKSSPVWLAQATNHSGTQPFLVFIKKSVKNKALLSVFGLNLWIGTWYTNWTETYFFKGSGRQKSGVCRHAYVFFFIVSAHVCFAFVFMCILISIVFSMFTSWDVAHSRPAVTVPPKVFLIHSKLNWKHPRLIIFMPEPNFFAI